MIFEGKYRWSYFEATGILKQFGYDDHLKYRLWWYINEEEKYVRIVDDNDTGRISDYVIQNKRVARIYVENSVIGIVGANVGGGPINVSGGVDDAAIDVSGGFVNGVDEVSGGKDDVGDEVSGDETESSEDEHVGARLDDSEEKRSLGLDDELGVDSEDPPLPPPPPKKTNAVDANSRRMNVLSCVSGSSSFVVDDLDVGYVSEELDSSDPDTSGDEKEPRYDKFNMDELLKSYKFNGMKKNQDMISFKEKIEGDATKQYNLLWKYSAELQRVNRGNTCMINMERLGPQLQPRFSSFYFSFDGIKKGFTTACRPFIGADGCHLKTKYGGTLLIVVARDPNDQYYPLAFGVCETETKESWKWFLTLLLEDIG